MAWGRGFEPLWLLYQTVFKTAVINHLDQPHTRSDLSKIWTCEAVTPTRLAGEHHKPLGHQVISAPGWSRTTGVSYVADLQSAIFATGSTDAWCKQIRIETGLSYCCSSCWATPRKSRGLESNQWHTVPHRSIRLLQYCLQTNITTICNTCKYHCGNFSWNFFCFII